MFGFLKKLFGTKPTVSPCSDAPYKIETPEPVKQAEAKTTLEFHEELKQQVKAAPKKKPAVKKPAAPKQTGGKKPRKPKSKA